MLCLLGPSGAGKSTLINCTTGLPSRHRDPAQAAPSSSVDERCEATRRARYRGTLLVHDGGAEQGQKTPNEQCRRDDRRDFRKGLRAVAFDLRGARSHSRSAQAAGLLGYTGRAIDRNPEGAHAAALRLVALLTPPTEVEGAHGGLAPSQKRKVDRYVRENLARPLRIKELADQVQLSTSHFCRAFKESFGVAPHMHIIRLRVELAQRLMLRTKRPTNPDRARLRNGRPGASVEALPAGGRRDPELVASAEPPDVRVDGPRPADGADEERQPS